MDNEEYKGKENDRLVIYAGREVWASTLPISLTPDLAWKVRSVDGYVPAPRSRGSKQEGGKEMKSEQ